MSRGQLDYGRLVEDALRTVVRDVLRRMAKGTVPSPHHYYVTFKTTSPGVSIADFLRERYPNEMTIVLQHQYWDLEAGEDEFGVTLSFNEMPQRLIIPYTAIKVFADPSAEFGLQFTIEPEAPPAPQPPAEILALPTKDKTETPTNEGGAEVVKLDRFRKK